MINRVQQLTPPKASFRVLVIGNHENNRDQIAGVLGKSWPFERDMQLVWAVDTVEALARLETERCTLILLPDDGGTEILRQLRAHGVRIPAVMVSALRRDDLLDNLESLAAAHVHHDEMNMLTFYNAISTSLRLLGFIPRSPQPLAAN